LRELTAYFHRRSLLLVVACVGCASMRSVDRVSVMKKKVALTVAVDGVMARHPDLPAKARKFLPGPDRK